MSPSDCGAYSVLSDSRPAKAPSVIVLIWLLVSELSQLELIMFG